MKRISRRAFTRSGVAAAAGTALSRTRILGANDRINIGVIGDKEADQICRGLTASRGNWIELFHHKGTRGTALMDFTDPLSLWVEKACQLSGVNPSTMSKRAASSPARDCLSGAKSTIMDSRSLGSRTPLRMESRSLPGSPLT